MNQLLKLSCVFALAFLTSLTPDTWAQETDSPGDKKAAAEQEDGADEKPQDEKSKDEIELKGVFEATDSSPIMISPEEWTTLTVEEAVEHGTDVDQGDILLKLDTDKIDVAIRDAEAELDSEKLSLENAEIKFELARRNQEMALAAAETAERLASEDLKEFITTGRDRRIDSVKRSTKSSRDSLAYQLEELRQLERMYQADDLTEETEEIILKRTRDAVERAQYFVETALDSERRSLTYTIPRSEEELKMALKRAVLALEEARRTAPNTLKQQELTLAKQRVDLEKKQEKLDRIRADRKLLEVRAPGDGIVYYGGSKRGKWSDSSTIGAMLQPGGTVKAKIVIMTVVRTERLTVRASVPEGSLRYVRPGVKAEISAVAFPDEKLTGEVTSVSAIPISDGVFDAVLDVDLGDLQGRIVPGMKAELKIKKDHDEQADDE